MTEYLIVLGVSTTLSVLSNVLSRRFGIGRRLREAAERAALDAH